MKDQKKKTPILTISHQYQNFLYGYIKSGIED